MMMMMMMVGMLIVGKGVAGQKNESDAMACLKPPDRATSWKGKRRREEKDQREKTMEGF